MSRTASSTLSFASGGVRVCTVSSDLLERLVWTIMEHRGDDPGLLAQAVVREIESRHKIIDPDVVTEEMLEACFSALLEHYDPPDPRRRPFHALKARKRYIAMARAAPKIVV